MAAAAEINNAPLASSPDTDAGLLAVLGQTLRALAVQPGVMAGIKDAADGRYLWASDSLAAFYGRAAA